MKAAAIIAVVTLATAPILPSTPGYAATAFQSWAQGRGVYVPSKERLSTFQDDLGLYGVAPPPDESPRYRWRRLQERYGVVGQPYDAYRY